MFRVAIATTQIYLSGLVVLVQLVPLSAPMRQILHLAFAALATLVPLLVLVVAVGEGA